MIKFNDIFLLVIATLGAWSAGEMVGKGIVFIVEYIKKFLKRK